MRTSRILNYIMAKSYQVFRDQADSSITILPKEPTCSLIWLHGLGDTSEGFLDYFRLKQSPVSKGARVVLLQAPCRKVTIYEGNECNSWYDIKAEEGTDEEKYNLDEVKQSLAIIDNKVTEQIAFWKGKGVEESEDAICKRIFLGGFSQGCAISLCYGLSNMKVLGGVIGLSGDIFESFPFKNKDLLPMLVYHGTEDDVINYKQAESLYAKYLKSSPLFAFRLIPGLFHSVNGQQLSQLTEWMQQKIKLPLMKS